MAAKSGRSVSLLPQGFLNRQSETDIRAALIKSDRVEAVIGLGRRLFYNSGMESCLLVCRSTKQKSRIGKILFIDAVNLVERDGDHNRLISTHMHEILSSYHSYTDKPGFARVATIKEIEANGWSLGIKFYTATPNDVATGTPKPLVESWRIFEHDGLKFWKHMGQLEDILDALVTEASDE